MERGKPFQGFPSRRTLFLLACSAGLLFLPASLAEPAKLSALAPLTYLKQLTEKIRTAFIRYEIPPELKSEQEHLRRRLDEAEFENRRLRNATAALAGIEKMDLARDYSFRTAEVILPRDASPWRESLVIGLGTQDGARAGMAVVWQRILVGRIEQAALTTSRVLLSSDPKFRIGAVVPAPDGTASYTGILQGQGDSRLVLRWLLDPSDFEAGTSVYTMADPSTGVPAGLLVGRIAGIDRVGGGYANIMLDAAARASALETVTVLIPARGSK